MARKKQTEANSLGPKPKGLFDHIRHIREVQSPDYFSTLSEADQKSWSNYMICRFLSMDVNCIQDVNDIQFYSSILKPKEFYQLCIAVIPKRKCFSPYVKNKTVYKWKSTAINILINHFQESERNVLEFLSIITDEEVKRILSLYGNSEKDINKMMED